MAKAKLTKRFVEQLVPASAEFVVWDTTVRRLGIRVSPSGRKGYFVKYSHHGRQRKVTIGPADVMTPDQARAAAMQLLNESAQGRDPASARLALAAEPTVGQAFGAYLAKHVEARRKARTAVEYRRMYDSGVRPRLGRRRLSDVFPADVAAVHASLRDTPHKANLTLAVMSAFFGWCERPEVRLREPRTNPCYKLERYKVCDRERFLSPAEFGRLGQALKAAEAREWPWAVPGVRLLLFTGARRNEILKLRWEYVDLERRRLNLPDSKTGAKTIILSQPALEVLRDLDRRRSAFPSSPWVLPSPRDSSRPLAQLQEAWGRIRKSAGLEDVRLHDLRHSFASVAAARGTAAHLIQALLGHADARTTAKYMHLADDPIRTAADQVAEQIAAAMGEGARAAPIAP